jgi:hypothetical protein
MSNASQNSIHKLTRAGITKIRKPVVCSRSTVDAKRRLVHRNIMRVFSREDGPRLLDGQYDRMEDPKARTKICMALCWALSGTTADDKARATMTTALENLFRQLCSYQPQCLGNSPDISFDPCDLEQEELCAQLARIFIPDVYLNREKMGQQLLETCDQECKQMLMRRDGSSQDFLERILSHDWK